MDSGALGLDNSSYLRMKSELGGILLAPRQILAANRRRAAANSFHNLDLQEYTPLRLTIERRCSFDIHHRDIQSLQFETQRWIDESSHHNG